MWFLYDQQKKLKHQEGVAREAEVCETRTVFLQQRIVLLHLILQKSEADWLFCGFRISMHAPHRPSTTHSWVLQLFYNSQKQSSSTEPINTESPSGFLAKKVGSKSDKKPTVTNSHIKVIVISRNFFSSNDLFRFTRNSVNNINLWPLKPHTPLWVSLFLQCFYAVVWLVLLCTNV